MVKRAITEPNSGDFFCSIRMNFIILNALPHARFLRGAVIYNVICCLFVYIFVFGVFHCAKC